MPGSDPVVIVAAARTPMGHFKGELAELSATDLGSLAIKAAVDRAGLTADEISEVLMGCVLPAGLGQAPARQAALGAGLSNATSCTTLNKVCGSAMKAIMFAHDGIKAGSADIVVAGGMESMSNAPYLLDKARFGQRLGHGRMIDHMAMDGLEDAYDKGRVMGTFAEDTARLYQFTRAAQDQYALESLCRAQAASASGAFTAEIVPVATKAGEITLDEGPAKARPEKIPTLRPAFRSDGTVTAANAASISDGAAAIVLMRRSEAERRGCKPLATVVGHASHAAAPASFSTAPIGAMIKLLDRADWDKSSVDLFEINEAFALVPMAAMRDLDLPHGKVNVHGGACVLGHPLGTSGARIVVTLLSALQQQGGKRGVASLCIGGGEATALAVELI